MWISLYIKIQKGHLYVFNRPDVASNSFTDDFLQNPKTPKPQNPMRLAFMSQLVSINLSVIFEFELKD